MQRYEFETRCVEAKGDDIINMTEGAREITANTFKKHCKWRAIAESLGYATGKRKQFNLRLDTDRCVSFYKSKYQGKSCYYFVWSAIEHVFLAQPHEAY